MSHWWQGTLSNFTHFPSMHATSSHVECSPTWSLCDHISATHETASPLLCSSPWALLLSQVSSFGLHCWQWGGLVHWGLPRQQKCPQWKKQLIRLLQGPILSSLQASTGNGWDNIQSHKLCYYSYRIMSHHCDISHYHLVRGEAVSLHTAISLPPPHTHIHKPSLTLMHLHSHVHACMYCVSILFQ